MTQLGLSVDSESRSSVGPYGRVAFVIFVVILVGAVLQSPKIRQAVSFGGLEFAFHTLARD